MADPTDFQFDLPSLKRPNEVPKLAEVIHKRAWAAAPRCTSARHGAPEETVRLLVIHATAGASTAGAVSVMDDARASFHWIVPDEDEPAHGAHVWATAPEARAAWHVRRSCRHPDICDGATNLNRASLGVEIVNRQSGGDSFSDWQIRATAAITRYAWARYPRLVHVASHARLDPHRRTDPGANFPWADFENLVLSP